MNEMATLSYFYQCEFDKNEGDLINQQEEYIIYKKRKQTRVYVPKPPSHKMIDEYNKKYKGKSKLVTLPSRTVDLARVEVAIENVN